MNKVIRWSLRMLGGIALLLTLNGAVLWAVGAVLSGATTVDLFAAPSASYYRRAIPEEIGITSMIAHGSDASPLSREACGGFAFQLSDETIAQIATQGLALLKSARLGRGYKGGPEEAYYTYQPWQETPVPRSWNGESAWAAGLTCLGQYARGFDTRAVFKAAREPGAFFTTGPETQMLIIPQRRLVVVTYLG